MAESSEPRFAPIFRLAVIGVALAATCWFFPLFHVVSLKPSAGWPAKAALARFDPKAAAVEVWATRLPAAVTRAIECGTLVAAMRENPAEAKRKFATSSGLGTPYYLVRGSGKVVTRERNYLRLAVDGATPAMMALRIGPIFGNTVRDGCGVLDVNAYPGLEAFNALSAELNALVEAKVLPGLRERAKVGATVRFTGCAEAPDEMPETGEPVLTVIPLKADVP